MTSSTQAVIPTLALAGEWTIDDTVQLMAAGRSDYRLTAEQRAAVAAPLEPGLIIAGAGTGKTEVMAARVVHLVATGAVRPDQVLGLTFTVKAAASLANRIRGALGRLAAVASRPTDESTFGGEPTVVTYHGYGARLVADWGLWLGVEPTARLAGPALAYQLALRLVRSYAGPLTTSVLPTTVAERVVELADELANHLVTPDDVRAVHQRWRDRLAAETCNAARDMRRVLEEREQLLPLVEQFTDAKRRRELLDYGDQIALAARLAELTTVRETERAAYRVVLLDEYQDTGVSQRLLLQGLFGDGHPVTAVGDPAQSIYGFRGASVGNILHFPRHFPHRDGRPARSYPLTTNFRSGGRILDAANAVVGRLSLPGDVDAPRLVPVDGREAASERGGWVRVAVQPDAEAEASWVAEQVHVAVTARAAAHAASCARPGCAGWHEAAVLCRRRSQFPLLKAALEAVGAPVEVVGLGGLLDAPEVAEVVAVLRVLHDPGDNAALLRLLTGPRWRIGVRDLDALARRAELVAPHGGRRARRAAEPGEPLLQVAEADEDVEVPALWEAVELVDASTSRLDDEAPLSDAARGRLRRLRDEMTQLRSRLGQPLPQLLADIERRIGLDVEILSAPEPLQRGRRADLAAFGDLAAEFVGLDGETGLGAFLDTLTAAEQAEEGYDLAAPSSADTVKLLTIHAAKGLEWDVVVVPGICGGRHSTFPSGRTRPTWLSCPNRIPDRLRGDAADLPALAGGTTSDVQKYKDAIKELEQAEERRLAYVALTRARELLVCSGYWWGLTAQNAYVPLSPFLAEVIEVCEQGAGEVLPVPPPPGKEDKNPLLAAQRQVDVPWPPPAEAPAALRVGAKLVRAAIEGADPGDGDPGLDSRVELADDGELSAADAQRAASWARDAELLLREAGQARSVGSCTVPEQLTVSDVVEVGRDPLAFARRLRRPLPRPPSRSARRGTSFHAWLEERAGVRALLEPEDVVDDEPVLAEQELRELQQRFLASSWAQRRPAEVEVPFELVLGRRLVRGRIDAVYRVAEDDAAEWDVIDFKTGARPTGHALDQAALQLACYRAAWADLAGVDEARVRAGFLYVREGDDGLVRPRLPSRAELVRLLDALPAERG